MPYGINRVTVIGAGTMGAAIAGHLANAGTPVTLLDMAPTELTQEEQAAGLTLEHPKVRNRLVRAGFERMSKSKPANLYTPEMAARIQLGNTTDDLESAVATSDWIIEAIVERPEPKQALMERIEAAAAPHAIITTNTSGIPIRIIGAGRSADFMRRFMGTHFFNPPRYLHLLEIIPTEQTDPALIKRIRQFAENVLGKGVVICKDTPNFIANRMISFIQSDILEYAVANGYTVDEIDRLAGQLIGRPKTGVFRLNDIIGIDVLTLVSDNLYDMIPDDESREIYRAELSGKVLHALISRNLLGSKTGQGFYKTVVDKQGNKTFWGLDLQHAAKTGEIEYLEPSKPRWASVGEVRDLPLPERLRRLVQADDRAGEFIWYTLSRTLTYAALRVPEIADSLLDIDNAMRWGFAWELGPFETWDVLGVQETVARMEGEGLTVAPWVHTMLATGHPTFYSYNERGKMVYSPLTGEYLPVEENPQVIEIADLRRRRASLAENESATLFDMGDGVMLLEFHTKVNAMDSGIFDIMQKAIDRLHGNATGLVIGNEGVHFSAGANLVVMGVAAQARQWDEIEQMVRYGQQTLMALRRAPRPVVAAPFGRVLGGGVEVCLAADRIVAHAETYMGLVEAGVGIVPAWGGCKEMVRRLISPHMRATNVNPSPYLRQAFELIGFAKVSTSAHDAANLGFLTPGDRIVLNREHLLASAKQEVLTLASGYAPPVTEGNVYAAGRDTLASVRIEVYSLLQGGYITPHDAKIANHLGYVLCGGDISAPTWMDEQYFLDLEREALLCLVREEKTQERIWYMLQNNKPLRN